MKETIVDIIESVFPKCKNLDIKSTDELGKIMYVMGFLVPTSNFWSRVWEPEFEDDVLLIDFLNSLWDVSKSDLMRLIKGSGLKVNNEIPSKDMKLGDLPWTDLDEDWSFCVVKKGKNQFDFILKAK